MPPVKRRFKGTTGLFARPLHEYIAEISKATLAKKGFIYTRLLTHWAEILGPEMAPYCLPHDLSFPPNKRTDGTLTLCVDSARATELQHMAPLMIEKMSVYFGYRAITRIKIIQNSLALRSATVAPAPPPRRKKTQASPTTPPPLPFAPDSELGKALLDLQNSIIHLD